MSLRLSCSLCPGSRSLPPTWKDGEHFDHTQSSHCGCSALCPLPEITIEAVIQRLRGCTRGVNRTSSYMDKIQPSPLRGTNGLDVIARMYVYVFHASQFYALVLPSIFVPVFRDMHISVYACLTHLIPTPNKIECTLQYTACCR